MLGFLQKGGKIIKRNIPFIKIFEFLVQKLVFSALTFLGKS